MLHDIPHTKNTGYSKNVRKRAKQLSTPDNIVLVVSPTLGGGGHPMSVYTILHNWGHMMSSKWGHMGINELPLSVCKVLIQAGIDLVDKRSNENLYNAFVETREMLHELGEDALYEGPFGVIDTTHTSQVFAMPSDNYA